jgi:hypothetical protein
MDVILLLWSLSRYPEKEIGLASAVPDVWMHVHALRINVKLFLPTSQKANKQLGLLNKESINTVISKKRQSNSQVIKSLEVATFICDMYDF